MPSGKDQRNLISAPYSSTMEDSSQLVRKALDFKIGEGCGGGGERSLAGSQPRPYGERRENKAAIRNSRVKRPGCYR